LVNLEVWLLALTLAGSLLGSCGILLARVSRAPGLILCGRTLFLATLFFLCGCSLFAAFHRADGLILLGLTSGALVILMLWEVPGQTARPFESLSLVEEK
jgi:hypothetical protein